MEAWQAVKRACRRSIEISMQFESKCITVLKSKKHIENLILNEVEEKNEGKTFEMVKFKIKSSSKTAVHLRDAFCLTGNTVTHYFLTLIEVDENKTIVEIFSRAELWVIFQMLLPDAIVLVWLTMGKTPFWLLCIFLTLFLLGVFCMTLLKNERNERVKDLTRLLSRDAVGEIMPRRLKKSGK